MAAEPASCGLEDWIRARVVARRSCRRRSFCLCHKYQPAKAPEIIAPAVLEKPTAYIHALEERARFDARTERMDRTDIARPVVKERTQPFYPWRAWIHSSSDGKSFPKRGAKRFGVALEPLNRYQLTSIDNSYRKHGAAII